MAQRKTAPRRTARRSPKKSGRVSASMAFWVLFFVVLVSIFFILLPMVKKGITLSQRQPATEQPAVEDPAVQEPRVQEPRVQEPRVQPKPTAQKPLAEKPAEKKPAQKPAEKKPETKPQEKPAPEKPPAQPATQQPAKQPEKPAAQPATQQPAKQPQQPANKPPETRDRSVYFMRDADLTLAKATRKLAVSDSPLIDCVNALLAGPTADEKNRGMISLIPSNTRLLSARVAGNTVHLNFNEEFRYNTSGREGCEAQLRQIVWTATEFPNVNNVQIEIEGKIVDFLVEGIAIRNPIGR